MADIEVFRARNTTGLAINGMRVTDTKPYGLMQTIQLFKCKDENIIEALAADVQPTDRWISVEDRLPVIDEQVMVYIRNPDDRHNNIELAYLSDESDDEFPYWVFDDNSRFYSTRFRYVTHWQPLPEPPKATE